MGKAHALLDTISEHGHADPVDAALDTTSPSCAPRVW